VPCRKAAKGECLGVPALLFLKMTGQPLTVATQKAVDKVTIDVITPYVMASTAPRKKQATTQPVGETVALSFSSMLQAQAESAAALEGSGNLLEMSLSMLRATTASLASQLVQGYSPPPVTMALVEAAGKWSSNALSFELFRASLPDDEDLRDMVERAALGRREALAGSIAASALADSLRRSGVPGAEISQTFLLTGVPTTITVGKAEQQQVLHRVIRTGEYGQVLACAQLSALSVHGNVHSCSLDLHLLILALDAQLLNTHTLATLFTWEQLPAPSSEKRYKIDCRGLGGIKTVSKSDLRHLVDVQKVYNGTKLTFAPHQMHVVSAHLCPARSALTTDHCDCDAPDPPTRPTRQLHAVEVEGFVLAVQTEYPANGSLANGLTADVTQQATNSLVDKLSAVKNNLVHGKQLAAFIAAMLASLGYNR